MSKGFSSSNQRGRGRAASPTVSKFSYDLFELAHILRVRPRATLQAQEQSGNTSRSCLPPAHLPFIQTASWYKDDYGCLLVLLCSNGALLLWSTSKDKSPVTKQISWFQNPKRAIKALSLDPSGCWLVCACMDTNLYIVPIQGIIKTEGRKLPTNRQWKDDDITKVASQNTRSQPGSVAWWHTEDDYQMCIVGTELGEVMLVDLCTGASIMAVDLKESVTTLELLQDKQHQITSVMIGTTSGETWQLILESKSISQRKLSLDRMNSPSVASGMGYEMVGLMGIPLESFQGIKEWQDRLVPMPIKSPMGEVLFSVQHARKQVFIGAHNQRTDILQVYDTDIDHLPMFIYQLPTGTSEFLLTDRLLFTVVHADQAKTSLCILSSQLAETSQSIPRSPKNRSDSSIIQTFTLPPDEQVVGLFKETKIMEGLQKPNSEGEGSGGHLPSRMYSVDGCILVTTSAIYECRPSISPEKLFLDLAINNTDNIAADMLAITTGLDVNTLYEMAAEEALDKEKYEHAMKLYQLSKCPFSKRVAQFAKHNRVGDILTYLRQALSKHSDFHTAERKQLSNFALYCFVQQILEYSGQAKKQNMLSEAFSQFINDNFDYDQYCALKLLASHGLKEHLFDVAKARGLMAEALDVLYQTGQFHLSTELLNKLAARGFTDIVSKASKGAFLYTMGPNEAVNFLLTKPETILSHLKFLLSQLISLEEESLIHIAKVLDPSRPSFRSLLSKIKTTSKSRSVSISSMASLLSLESTASFTMEEMKQPSIADLLHLFLCCLLVLNHHREKQQDPLARISNIKFVCGQPTSPTRSDSRKREGTIDTLCQRTKLSCGQQHTAVISTSGDVYTWGKSHKGRLGHGDLIEEEGKSTPFRVEILHMHRIKVLSVACGIEHTLALCRDGVYAWGSSEYGQLGQGDTKQHTRPVFITELSDKSCIAVACGHYHSLALSADQRVWSWGWGVHGQLGMGSIEDMLLPSHVTSLDHLEVTQMAAGYSHTVVLTTEGQAYTFGGGLYGQLGLGTNTKQTLPRLVESLKEKHISMICCGSFETVAVTSDQKVYNWGRNPHYVRLHMKPEIRTKKLIGSSSSGSLSHRLVPTLMNCTFGSRIAEIHCGNLHYLVVMESGEVFSWGFNDHGQLGYGNKKEEQSPSKPIPGLKDKYIKTASVGAEFSVAMDASGQVFVWGRADSGQLGLDASLIGSTKEISNPVALTNLPLLNSEESASLSESVSSSEPMPDIDWKLPDLSQVGSRGMIYGREALTLALNSLYLNYSNNLVLRHSQDIKDYLSSSVIFSNLNQWSEALGIRLKFLSQCYNEADGGIKEDIFLEFAIAIISHSLGIIEEKDPDLYGYDEQVKHILQEILKFWSMHKLPQQDLENILSVHLEKIAYPLSLLIIRNSVFDQQEQSASSPVHNEFQELSFSGEFLTCVVQLVSNSINSGSIFEEYNGDLSALLSESEMLQNEANKVEFTFGSTEDENSVTSSQLLQGIMENLQKDLEKCTSISLSTTTAATIAAAAVSQQREVQRGRLKGLDNNYGPDVVVFTCNHQFPRVYFMENILPEFQQRMSELLIPLVKTTKALVTHYKKSESNLLAACPVCVYNSLRSEQLEKASDNDIIITNGIKSKPWDV